MVLVEGRPSCCGDSHGLARDLTHGAPGVARALERAGRGGGGGESRIERLDVTPARVRVLVTVRPKYVCRPCNGAQHAQAPAPEWLVPRGLPTEALVAHSMVAKFGDYLPSL